MREKILLSVDYGDSNRAKNNSFIISYPKNMIFGKNFQIKMKWNEWEKKEIRSVHCLFHMDPMEYEWKEMKFPEQQTSPKTEIWIGDKSN